MISFSILLVLLWVLSVGVSTLWKSLQASSRDGTPEERPPETQSLFSPFETFSGSLVSCGVDKIPQGVTWGSAVGGTRKPEEQPDKCVFCTEITGFWTEIIRLRIYRHSWQLGYLHSRSCNSLSVLSLRFCSDSSLFWLTRLVAYVPYPRLCHH